MAGPSEHAASDHLSMTIRNRWPADHSIPSSHDHLASGPPNPRSSSVQAEIPNPILAASAIS
ncbi:hypothetical protein ACLOJK_036458, partial [Asimina triloba]